MRLGPAELFLAGSLLAVSGLLTVAFLNDWFIALVPAATYALAIGVAYGFYRRYVSREADVSKPVDSVARFRVVLVQGRCLLGRREGEVLTVGPAGAVTPPLCAPAEQVLRRAVAVAQEQEVEGWCCPIFDHMLVFRRVSEAA